MDKTPHPFVTLRRKIRQAGRQFRQNNDNSQSLFHPDGGFVYAYDIMQVEQALDNYEKTLGSELDLSQEALTPEEHLMQEAKLLSQTHPSRDTRSFAQDVLEYLEEVLPEQQPKKTKVVSIETDRVEP